MPACTVPSTPAKALAASWDSVWTARLSSKMARPTRRATGVAYTLNVDADRFAIDYRNPFAWGNGIVFRLTDLDFSNGASLQSLMVDTNMVGYGLTVGADYVDINLSGVHGTRDAYFHGQFITTAVPEPTSFAMLSLGLAVVGFGARRARKARQG